MPLHTQTGISGTFLSYTLNTKLRQLLHHMPRHRQKGFRCQLCTHEHTGRKLSDEGLSWHRHWADTQMDRDADSTSHLALKTPEASTRPACVTLHLINLNSHHCTAMNLTASSVPEVGHDFCAIKGAGRRVPAGLIRKLPMPPEHPPTKFEAPAAAVLTAQYKCNRSGGTPLTTTVFDVLQATASHRSRGVRSEIF